MVVSIRGYAGGMRAMKALMLMSHKEQLIKISEVAGKLGFTERTIRRWVAEKNMPAYKPGRSYLFLWSEVQDWMKRCNDESSDDDSGGGNPA